MKKILLLLFTLIPLAAKCPPDYCLPIKRAEAIKPYERLWNAVCTVESGNNAFAVNEKEQAFGCSQIRQCRLDHYAKETGIFYTLTDCFDKEVSREVFMYFAEKIKNEEQIAKSWNAGASGIYKASAQVYWKKVEKHLIN